MARIESRTGIFKTRALRAKKRRFPAASLPLRRCYAIFRAMSFTDAMKNEAAARQAEE